MIERTFDDALINSIIGNDPEFCIIRNAKELPQLYFMHAPGVGMFPSVFIGGEMDMHACIYKESRGKKAVLAALECFEWVFKNTNARKITTKVRKENRSARMFAAYLMERIDECDGWIYYEVPRWADL